MSRFKTLIQDRFFIAKISFALYGISLCIPALHMTHVNTRAAYYLFGSGLLLDGIWGLVFYGLYGWLANPFYLITMIFFLLGSYRATITFGCFTILLMLTTFQLYFQQDTFLLDESGGNAVVFSNLTIGSYIWFLSLLLPFCFALYYLKKKPGSIG